MPKTQIEKTQTKLVHYVDKEGGQRELLCKYGMLWIKGNELPHFIVINAKGRDALEEERQTADLKPLIKWHLCDQDGTPLHYVENGAYLWSIGDIDNFELCAVIEEEEREEYSKLVSEEEIRTWLVERLPKVQQGFISCMKEYKVKFIDVLKTKFSD